MISCGLGRHVEVPGQVAGAVAPVVSQGPTVPPDPAVVHGSVLAAFVTATPTRE